MAGKIFINYRRGDDAGFTQALYQRLEGDFSAHDLFMDVEGKMAPGDDFVEVLSAQVDAADIFLVVIGPRWADLLTARKEDPDDFVVIEIKAALELGKRVIPVLVGGAAMPRTETLPPSIRALARRNAIGLRPDRFKADCQGLITALKASLSAAEQERAARTVPERNAAEAARLQAEARAATRAATIEQQSRAQAAAGVPPAEMRKGEELANWRFVQERGDIQDVRDHLARFPGGITEEQALEELDDRAWLSLHPHPTVEGLRAYLGEFPNGALADEARARIAELGLEALEADMVRQLEPLERQDWERVASSMDIAEVELFLKNWPNGAHAAMAHVRIEMLKAARPKMRLAVLKSAWFHGVVLLLSLGLTWFALRAAAGPWGDATWAMAVIAVYVGAVWAMARRPK